MFETIIQIEDELLTREVCNFINVAKEACKLYARKNHDYGDSFTKGMDTIGINYGVGRLYDKMNRIINLSKSNDIAETTVNDETIEDTLKDLACYSIMLICYRRDKAKQQRENVVLE